MILFSGLGSGLFLRLVLCFDLDLNGLLFLFFNRLIAGAVRALGSFYSDLGETVGAFLGGGGLGFLGLFAEGGDLVDRLDDEEYHECHNDEIYYIRNELTHGHIELADLDGKADSAFGILRAEAVEYRLDDVVGEGCDESRKC